MAINQPSRAAGSSPAAAGPPARLADRMKLLMQTGLVIFVVTAAIGILNSFHFIKLPPQVLLTHVHSGTLGWITIGVMTIGMWLFGGGEMQPGALRHIRAVTRGAVFSLPLYVVGFLTGVWQISALLALPAFGVILGVLIQIELATKASFLPGGAFAAHPAMMVVGYLLLIGMGIAEWQLRLGATGISKLGAVQVVLPFLAGIVLMISLLTDNFKLAGLNVLLELIAVVIFVIRFAPAVARIRWGERVAERHVGAAALFIVGNVILLSYIIITVITNPNSPIIAQGSPHLIALDHMMFIGVMTNSIICMVRRLSQEHEDIWPWADQFIFWLINIGVVLFVITLLAGSKDLEKFFVPIMGVGVLLAIVTFSLRLARLEPGAPEARLAATGS